MIKGTIYSINYSVAGLTEKTFNQLNELIIGQISNGTWSHLVPGLFVIRSEKSHHEIFEIIHHHLPELHFVVLKTDLSKGQFSGYTAANARDWLQKVSINEANKYNR